MMKKAEQNNIDLIILIDKPAGYSSAKIVNIVKKVLNIRKAGHSGTLDPLATGLLIIATGKKTKDLNNYLLYDKVYDGTMVLGQRTKSFDLETEVYDTKPVDNITEEMIIQTAKELTGEIEQYPPMYSAVKHKGKPLYKFARKNIDIERAPKRVHIKKFEIKKVALPEVEFSVKCSKGTYIRALVNDFGDIIKTGAYMKDLRRISIGDFSITNALTLEKFREKYKLQPSV